MSIEKPIENWTKFPNYILDNIDKFTDTEFKVLAFMVRKTIGYQSPDYRFSLSYLSIKLNKSRQGIINAIKGLVEKDAIKLVGTMKNCKQYSVNWLVNSVDQSIQLTKASQLSRPELVNSVDPLKENIKKKTLKENNTDFSTEKRIVDYYNSKNKGQAEPVKDNKSVLKNIRATINEYSVEDLKNAIDNLYLDKWSIENKQIRINRLIKSEKRSSNMFKFIEKQNSDIPESVKNALEKLG